MANTRLECSVLGLLILFVVAALFFGAGYATRAAVSRKRYSEYLKYEPYLGAPRTTRPPAFLIRGGVPSASAPSDNSDGRSSQGAGGQPPQKGLSEGGAVRPSNSLSESARLKPQRMR
jgi:hypothetical protein